MQSKTIPPLQITYNKACQMLDVSRDTLRVLIRRDPSFPRPLKYCDTRQAPIYFDYAELIEWHNKRKMQS